MYISVFDSFQFLGHQRSHRDPRGRRQWRHQRLRREVSRTDRDWAQRGISGQSRTPCHQLRSQNHQPAQRWQEGERRFVVFDFNTEHGGNQVLFVLVRCVKTKKAFVYLFKLFLLPSRNKEKFHKFVDLLLCC